MDKAPDAFRTISEVADDLDVPQHVLRFWETRFAQIKPMKRSGGRRYYRRDDIELLRGIRHLLYGQGYTIRGVQRILREQGVKAVQGFDRGIAQPQPSAEIDDAADAAEQDFGAPEIERHDANELRRPANGASPVVASLRAPAVVLAAAVTVPEPQEIIERDRLSAEKANMLRSVLDDLRECQRLLDAAISVR